jgi:retron-type reverse transcriptase
MDSYDPFILVLSSQSDLKQYRKRILEADLKNFFGSLDHGWLLRFVEHRVGDPRIMGLIKRWLKAGVLEKGEFHSVEAETPQGGSISVLSNIYLH